MKQEPPLNDDFEANQYERYVHRSRMVGSEDYNAPEIVSEEVFADFHLE